MRYLISIALIALISGCSLNIVDMPLNREDQQKLLTDSDNDGVITARDKCPRTIAGARVNNDGCGVEIIKKIRRKLEVNFDKNSYVVVPKYYKEIEGLADFMREYPTTAVTIEGHTSKVGSKSYNLKLSQNRANAVKAILINNFGIQEDRVAAVGYGFERLLEEGKSDRANAKNRRIVAEISSEKYINDMKWTIYSVDKTDQ